MFASKSSNRLVRGISCFAFAAAFLVFTSTAFAGQRFTAVLSGAQETPPNGSTAKGFGYVEVSDDGTSITAYFGFSGLGTAATAAHIHTGAVGVAGPVTFGFTGIPSATSGTHTQTFPITAGQLATLQTSGMYFNVHTSGFPSGEIRGQILAPTCSTAGPVEVEATGGTAVGTPTAYATLGAAFTAINAGALHTTRINVEVCASTTETATASLDSSGAGSTSYSSVNIYPIAAATVTGNITGAVIKLNGADNVTIDGRISGTGTSRDLTVSNSSTAGSTAAIWVNSLGAGLGATNNTIRNLEIACGATQDTTINTTVGIIMSGGSVVSTTTDGPDNDNNTFVFNRIIRARYGIVTRGVSGNFNISPVIADNIIGPSAFGPDQIGRAGIFVQFDSNALITRNTIQFVGDCLVTGAQTCTSGTDNMGINLGSDSAGSSPGTLANGGVGYTVTKNIIHDVVEERTFSASGINNGVASAGADTLTTIANNFIYNIRANGTSGDQVQGIGIGAGKNDKIVFNSILITGDMDPGGTSSSSNYGSAIRIGNASGANYTNITVANNSVFMDVNSNTATLPFFDITVHSTTFAFGTGSLNYNNYYFPPANTQMNTGGISTGSTTPTGGTLFNTLAQWKLALTPAQDANSIQADPQYISSSNLHIPLASPNRNAGVAGTGVIDDIDAQVRTVGAPDIGADEPDGTTPPANDIGAAAIVNPATGSVVSNAAVITPSASFTNFGTATQTNVPVRFKFIDSGSNTVYNQTATIPSIASGVTATVNFPTTTLAVTGAYTSQASSELGSDTNTGNDTVSGTLTVVAALAGGTYTVGTGGNYPSLTNTGGIFDALNAAGASGNVTIDIISDLTGENGTVALNELPAGITVTIKPSGAARTITGSSANSIIRLNGADNVTVDGSLAGGNSNGVGGTPAIRNLSVTNTNTAATAGAVVAVMQGPNSANNVTIKNVIINGQDPAQTLVALHIGGNTVGTAPVAASNNNVIVENCAFQRAILAIFNDGASAAIPATGNIIRRNDMSATGSNRMRRAGIFVFNHNGILVTENKIGGIVADEAQDAIGIIAGIQGVSTTAVTSGGIFNSTISRNRIDVITSTNTTGFSAVGIAIAGDPLGPNTIVNNMITGVSAPATSPDIVAGIFVAGVPSSNTKLYYNSVSMTGARGAVASQIGSYGIAISGTDPTVELKNNIFYTTQTSGGGANAKSYAIGMTTTTFANLDSNNNNFWSTGANDGGFRTGSLDTTGTDIATLAAWQTAVADDAASVEVDPLFVNDVTDPHLTAASPSRNIGIPIAAWTIDYDRQDRPNPFNSFANSELVVQVDIGADEFYLTTASGVTVGGRVMAGGGRGLRGAVVTMTSMDGTVRNVVTGPYGMFQFDNVEPGQTYIVNIRSRRFMYGPQTVVVNDSIADLIFSPEQ